MSKPLIAIIPGHHVDVPGVKAGGWTEQAICRIVVERIYSIVEGAISPPGFVVYEPYVDILPLGVRFGKKTKSLDRRIQDFNNEDLAAIVELHLNSSKDPKEDYTLCVHATGSAIGKSLANHIGGGLEDVFDPPGAAKVWSDETLGRRLLILNKTKAPTVVVEPLFLSNARWQERLESNFALIVENYADAVIIGLTRWVADLDGLATQQQSASSPARTDDHSESSSSSML